MLTRIKPKFASSFHKNSELMKNNTAQKFGFAFKGIRTAIKEEAHLRFHLVFAALILLISAYLNLTSLEWIAILIIIGLVISAELMNSALENLVDLVQPDIHPLAGKVKDIAAGSVLFISIVAAAAGSIIFWPHICSLLA